MRSVALIAVVLAFAAACGGTASEPTPFPKPRLAFGESPSPGPTRRLTPTEVPPTLPPFTPEQETLVPPSDIDTSGWLTYRDAEHGFELRYPPEGRLQQHTSAPTFGAVGFGAEIDLPFPEGTTLEAKYLFIQQASGLADQCVPSKLRNALARGLTPDVQLITSATARFWRTELLSAGAMHGAHTTLYMASHASICITLSAVLAGVSPLAYSTPPPSPDAQEESKIFDAIVSTFRWID